MSFITDAGNYIWRINNLLIPIYGSFRGDKSFIYILPQSLLTKIFNLDAHIVFKYFSFVGPFITVLILVPFLRSWFRLMNIKFNYKIGGFFFLLLSFYLMIGGVAATFYYPSHYMMLLSMLLFSQLAFWGDLNLRNFWWKIILLSLLMLTMIYLHAAAYASILATMGFFVIAYFLKHTRDKNMNRKQYFFLIKVAVVICFLVFGKYYLHEISFTIKVTGKSSVGLYGDTVALTGDGDGTSRKSSGTSSSKYLVEHTSAFTHEHTIIYFARLHEVVFEYFLPNNYLGPLICLGLLFLFINSWRRRTQTLIKEAFLYVPLMGWFLLFLILTYFHSKAERLFEFFYPFFILLLASSIVDLIETCLEKFKLKKRTLVYSLVGGALTMCFVGAFFINLFLIWRENLKFKKFDFIPTEIIHQWNNVNLIGLAPITNTIVFFEYDQVLHYLKTHKIYYYNHGLATSPNTLMSIVKTKDERIFNNYYVEFNEEKWQEEEINAPKFYRFLASKLSGYNTINLTNQHYYVEGFKNYIQSNNLKPIHTNSYIEVYKLGNFINSNLYTNM